MKVCGKKPPHGWKVSTLYVRCLLRQTDGSQRGGESLKRKQIGDSMCSHDMPRKTFHILGYETLPMSNELGMFLGILGTMKVSIFAKCLWNVVQHISLQNSKMSWRWALVDVFIGVHCMGFLLFKNLVFSF